MLCKISFTIALAALAPPASACNGESISELLNTGNAESRGESFLYQDLQSDVCEMGENKPIVISGQPGATYNAKQSPNPEVISASLHLRGSIR